MPAEIRISPAPPTRVNKFTIARCEVYKFISLSRESEYYFELHSLDLYTNLPQHKSSFISASISHSFLTSLLPNTSPFQSKLQGQGSRTQLSSKDYLYFTTN